MELNRNLGSQLLRNDMVEEKKIQKLENLVEYIKQENKQLNEDKKCLEQILQIKNKIIQFLLNMDVDEGQQRNLIQINENLNKISQLQSRLMNFSQTQFNQNQDSENNKRNISQKQLEYNNTLIKQLQINESTQRKDLLEIQNQQIDHLNKSNRRISEVSHLELSEYNKSAGGNKKIKEIVSNPSSNQVENMNKYKEQPQDLIQTQKQNVQIKQKAFQKDNFNIILSDLILENRKLEQMVQRISKQRDIAQAQILINEQIARIYEIEEVNLVQEFSENIKQLQTQLITERKYFDKTISSYPSFLENNSKQNLISFRDRLQAQRQIMENLLDERNSLRQKVEELINLNSILTNAVKSKNISLDKKEILQDKQQVYTDKQKKIFEVEDDLQSEYGAVLFSDRVEKPLNKDILQKQNPVPVLDLNRAKKIMELQVEKQLEQYRLKQGQQVIKELSQLEQQQQKQNQQQIKEKQDAQNAVSQDQNQQTATEIKLAEKIAEQHLFIQKLKHQLAEEQCYNQIQKGKNKDILRILEEYENRQEILVNSNKNYLKKWEKFYPAYLFYRDFYYKMNIENNGNPVYLESYIKDKFFNQKQDQFKSYNLEQDYLYAPDSISRYQEKIKGKKEPIGLEDIVLYDEPQSERFRIQRDENQENENEISLEIIQKQSPLNILQVQQSSNKKNNQKEIENENQFLNQQEENNEKLEGWRLKYKEILNIARNFYSNDKIRNFNKKKIKQVPTSQSAQKNKYSNPNNSIELNKFNHNRNKRSSSLPVVDQTEKPIIFSFQLLKRLDRPIYRYYKQIFNEQQIQQEIANITKLKTPLQQMDELDKLLYIDQEFSINTRLLEPMPMHNGQNDKYFKYSQNQQTIFEQSSNNSFQNNNQLNLKQESFNKILKKQRSKSVTDGNSIDISLEQIEQRK